MKPKPESQVPVLDILQAGGRWTAAEHQTGSGLDARNATWQDSCTGPNLSTLNPTLKSWASFYALTWQDARTDSNP